MKVYKFTGKDLPLEKRGRKRKILVNKIISHSFLEFHRVEREERRCRWEGKC